MSKRDGYFGLYVQCGNNDKKLFDSGDILGAYPNLARYHIFYDVSVDGRYVVYSAINVLGDADIFVLDRETGESSNLTSDAHTDTYPVFSHDGEWIAYLSHEKGGRRYDEIFLIRRMYISQLDILGSEKKVYFQGKFMDRKRKTHHTIFSLDIEKQILRVVISEEFEAMNPIVRPDTEGWAGHLSL
jgi:hypothetical protein